MSIYCESIIHDIVSYVSIFCVCVCFIFSVIDYFPNYSFLFCLLLILQLFSRLLSCCTSFVIFIIFFTCSYCFCLFVFPDYFSMLILDICILNFVPGSLFSPNPLVCLFLYLYVFPLFQPCVFAFPIHSRRFICSKLTFCLFFLQSHMVPLFQLCFFCLFCFPNCSPSYDFYFCFLDVKNCTEYLWILFARGRWFVASPPSIFLAFSCRITRVTVFLPPFNTFAEPVLHFIRSPLTFDIVKVFN